MRNSKYFMIIFWSLLITFFSCSGQEKKTTFRWNESKTFIKEMPLKNDGGRVFDSLADVKYTQALQLNTIENGVDSFEMRLWYSKTKGKNKNYLIQVKFENKTWIINYYSFESKYNVSNGANTPENLVIKKISPSKNALNSIFTSITNTQIFFLKDQSEYNNYPILTDCSGIRVELSNRYAYKTFGYDCSYIESIKDKFEDAKQIEYFLKSICLALNIELER